MKPNAIGLNPERDAVADRRGQRAGGRRRALHEPEKLAHRHRAGGKARDAKGRRQGVRLHHPPNCGAGERDVQGGTRRQRAFRANLERVPGTSFPRRQARRRDQPDRPDQESTEANHPRRGPTGRRGRSYSKVSQYFPPLDLPPAVIFAKIVERCGNRKYWETWAEDVADIFARLVARIRVLLNGAETDALREWLDAFQRELRTTILSTRSAIATRPTRCCQRF